MTNLNLIDKAFLLKKTAIFSPLDLDLLLTVADKMEQRTYKQEEVIFHKGQEAHHMYLIIAGRVHIPEAETELVNSHIFGDEALFNNKARTYSAVSSSLTTLLLLSRSHLLSIIAECPSIALTFLEAYSTPILFRTR